MDLSGLLAKLRETGASDTTTNEEARAAALNSAPGDLPGPHCPLCRDRGYVAAVRDGQLYTRPCSCMAVRSSLRRIRESGLENLMERCTLASFQTPEPWQREVKRKALEFAARGGGGWLVASGAVGSGKTHLCTGVAGELMKAGRALRYMCWREEAPRLKALVNDREAYEREMRKLERVEVLYIDDFWKGTVSGPDVNLAFELLNHRYNDLGLVTLLSTEKTVEALLDTDEAVGSRIFERSRGYCLRFSGKNWRLR